MSQWTIEGPDRITVDEDVRTVHVRIIDGAVNVVAAEGPARLEVGELKGEPLHVTLVDGVLTVTYKDLNSWSDFGDVLKSVDSVKGFFSSLKRRRSASVTLTAPAGTEVKVGTVSADTTVSGFAEHVSAQSANGDVTLVGLAGRTSANTVSGDVDVQSVAGQLRLNTVSGQLTVVAGTADKVLANAVTGAVTLDLDVVNPTDIKVTTVSGPVGIRLPSLADTKVEAGTNSGDISSTFDQLKVGGTWGAKRLSGQLGDGQGSLSVTTVSGAVTVLRRPEAEDDGPVLVKELPAGPKPEKDAGNGPDLTKEA
ncbi:DUF4097 family beta strand repeat-containing protein [Kitasatospora sp. CM 4170]|uniref:DUF4097 domain-containing protein n=1 Tax=Kitasatospora aburaviensis TaxID=67265 RepID=A0ABW1F6K9_9ACTN|nr:DUF4097 family beta strand repeat-containing protein [Kitasatospora sp. CM 4170]WNM47661.1 DUF4097 family beta strand repeat-containing protein [Kitasatospora sp. CM 4170]